MLTQEEIYQKICENNELIERLVTPNYFTLNNSVAALLEENAKLQEQCTHEFIDGYCKWCFKEEE